MMRDFLRNGGVVRYRRGERRANALVMDMLLGDGGEDGGEETDVQFYEMVALGFDLDTVANADTRIADLLQSTVRDTVGQGLGVEPVVVDDETLSARIGMTVERSAGAAGLVPGLVSGAGLIWADMRNSAADPRRDFTVSGAVVRAAIVDLGCKPVVVWHSHLQKVGPSDEDVMNFPGWLAERGSIYTVRSNVTTMYGNSVAKSSASPEQAEGSRHG